MEPEIDEELTKMLKTWNPMHDDYSNSKFNQYSSGPGANLDPSLQPAQQAAQKQGSEQAYAYLVFRNMPTGMTKKALLNICERHGRVCDVRTTIRNDIFFVDLESVSDMEAVYSALENNKFGFSVQVGKHYSKRPNTSPTEQHMPPPLPADNINPIDVDNRSYRTSAKNKPRAHFKQDAIVGVSDYDEKDSLLLRNDPKRHYLITDDAHTLERAGEHKPNAVLNDKTNYKYRTGRAFIDMPEKTKQFIREKAQESTGKYIAMANKYEKTAIKVVLNNVGKCDECGRTCDIVCGNCNTFYCGRDCQQRAWFRHNQICGIANSLQSTSFTQIDTKSANTDKRNKKSQISERSMPRSGDLTTLTAITKTNMVFIRLKTNEQNLLYFKTITQIQAYSQLYKPLQKPPQHGEIVVVKMCEKYYRVMVLNANDLQFIKVVYLDYGNVDAHSLYELFTAPEYYNDLPRLVVPVILKDVPDCYMTDEIRKFMYSYLDSIGLVIKYNPKKDYIVEQGVYCVELIDETTNQNFNKMVQVLSKPMEPHESQDVIFREYLEQKLLPTGEHIELVVLDSTFLSTGCISCTTMACAIEIQNFQRELQRYGQSLKEQNYAPRINELCIARYSVDKNWYRARCLDLVGDGHPTLVFFDYGNIAMVSIKDIRRYPPQFTYPIYTVDCEIEGLPEHCNAQLVSKLEELITEGSTIKCDQIKVHEEDKFHTITLNAVISEIKTCGLLA